MQLDDIGRWVFGGGILEIHSWGRRKPKGERRWIDVVRRKRWTLEEPFNIRSLIEEESEWCNIILTGNGKKKMTVVGATEFEMARGIPWPDTWQTVEP